MTTFGLLLPHFGALATRERLVEGAKQIEDWGFGSVWARDNLMFRGHGFEPRGTRIVDPFSTLTAIAARTERIVLGTAVVVPFRDPLIVSQLLGGLSLVAGPDRMIVGLGAGNQEASFKAVGGPWDERFSAVCETAEVLRLTWSGPDVSYVGDIYNFENVTIDPRPQSGTPIWYGGSTPVSVRRAIQYCDGWMPGRCPLTTMDKRLRQLREHDGPERKMGVGLVPLVSVASSREAALEKVNAEGLLGEARSRRFWDGPFDSVDDLDGILVGGTPDDCIEGLMKFVERGLDQVVIDLRLHTDEWDEQLAWVAEEVLPAVQRAQGIARPSGAVL